MRRQYLSKNLKKKKKERAVWHICTPPSRGNADPVGGRVWSVHRTAEAERPGCLEQSWQEWEWALCSERQQRISCGAGEASVSLKKAITQALHYNQKLI